MSSALTLYERQLLGLTRRRGQEQGPGNGNQLPGDGPGSPIRKRSHSASQFSNTGTGSFSNNDYDRESDIEGETTRFRTLDIIMGAAVPGPASLGPAVPNTGTERLGYGLRGGNSSTRRSPGYSDRETRGYARPSRDLQAPDVGQGQETYTGKMTWAATPKLELKQVLEAPGHDTFRPESAIFAQMLKGISIGLPLWTITVCILQKQNIC